MAMEYLQLICLTKSIALIYSRVSRCGTPSSASLYCTSTSPVCSWSHSAQQRGRKSLTSMKRLYIYCVYSFKNAVLIIFKCFLCVLYRHGDMRVTMAYELFSMWQKLGVPSPPFPSLTHTRHTSITVETQAFKFRKSQESLTCISVLQVTTSPTSSRE